MIDFTSAIYETE